MKTGIYIDFDNIASNGLGSIQFEPLRAFYEGSGNVIQAHAYMAIHEAMEAENAGYAAWRNGCRIRLENGGFKIHQKPVKQYQHDDGTVTTKANFDVELTVDVMAHSDRLERVILMTGDGDFVRLVEALQSKGIWVEVSALANVSKDLIKASNRYTNPLLIPNVHWSKDYSYRRIYRVASFDTSDMVATLEYWEGSPSRLSLADPAHKSQQLKIDRAMYESHRFRLGKVLGWTGAQGLSAYHELA